MIMSTFELKFFTLAWNEAEVFIKMLKNCETLSPRFMPKSLEKFGELSSFRLRESHCVVLEILELQFKIIDFICS